MNSRNMYLTRLIDCSPSLKPTSLHSWLKVLIILATMLPIPALADGPVNIEILGGKANHSDHIVDAAVSAYGLRGVYDFSKHLAFEVSYQDFGKVKNRWAYRYFSSIKDEFSTTSLGAGVKGKLSLSSNWSMIGRVGLARWKHKINQSATGSQNLGIDYSQYEEDDGIDPYYGLGVEYRLNDQLHVGLEHSIHTIDVNIEEEAVNYSIEQTSIYFGYRF